MYKDSYFFLDHVNGHPKQEALDFENWITSQLGDNTHYDQFYKVNEALGRPNKRVGLVIDDFGEDRKYPNKDGDKRDTITWYLLVNQILGNIVYNGGVVLLTSTHDDMNYRPLVDLNLVRSKRKFKQDNLVAYGKKELESYLKRFHPGKVQDTKQILKLSGGNPLAAEIIASTTNPHDFNAVIQEFLISCGIEINAANSVKEYLIALSSHNGPISNSHAQKLIGKQLGRDISFREAGDILGMLDGYGLIHSRYLDLAVRSLIQNYRE
ncbi:hypothetical protein HY407_00340 [Candidatus Gottesmanbacteria bacterium]|nr:hypothetical protein [Candidatus Roizmanbacteria bacterium]MBI4066808.1 hypothetical protein [Candidatus Gottesmanbacteria bacterium]